jgi:endonuclease/exonuclease/phosphatase family metal-dependent hydrolase
MEMRERKRLLTWNLFHGRAVPGTGHDLRRAFEDALAGWDWDVALLQEVPPWWPPALARACGAQASTAPTSRNALLAVRRALAERRPDVMKSNGGGANAILVRGPIAAERRVLLRRWPERRVCHAVLLADGTWCANLHAQVHSPERARADIERAAAATLRWAAGAPAVLGGDFNVRAPAAPGFAPLGGHGVDHVLGHDLVAAGSPDLPDRGELSDHAPVVVTVLPRERPRGG